MKPELTREIVLKRKQRYQRLKQMNPDLYQRAIEIGSIVTCCGETDLYAIGARVEQAVVDQMLRMLEENHD